MARLSTATFMVTEVDGSWSVTRDSLFYGDYQSCSQAIAGAQLGARAVETRGGTARVLLAGKVIAH